MRTRFWNPVGKYLLFSVCLLFLSLISACKEDEIDPVETPAFPWGFWSYTFPATPEYHADLLFDKAASTYHWVMMDTLSGIENNRGSVLISGSLLKVYNNPDCWATGNYQFMPSAAGLNILLQSDSCPGRSEKLKALWQPKDMSGMHDLSGSWERTIQSGGIDYRVKLSLETSGRLTWEMIDPIPGHTNSTVSYTANDTVIVIYKDPDCPGNGYYRWNISGNVLTIGLVKDQCPPRAPSFSGEWIKP